MKDQLKTIREAAWVLREHNHLHFGSDHNTIAEADKITAALAQIEAMAGTQEPMFWVRLCRDGMYEGPIHNAQIERVRAQSGAWSPLFLSAAPVAQQPQAEAPVIAQNKAAPVASWNDSRTQKVYEVLTNDNYPPKGSEEHWEGWKARLVVDALFPEQPQKLEDIEQYRMQMAGISTAAIGYWKEGDSIHPDYDTLALRDVAKLYAKYDALHKAQQPQAEAVPPGVVKDVDVEAAAKKMAEIFDYPWGFMPEKGRNTMRENVRAVLDAAIAQQKGGV